ncbi:tetratricopeptide repeat protein [Myxococcus llanfairpwllgwyngyllgogerychwyrndrobwllllantysiliogogogochensis]|uniref:tetratricopeptide repeat protein n=1 Tax=Myxococcus TaxID=32 RepID=UPI001FECDBC4|nr:tetratricopeptide repeat protein [Myxococcus llanfairpwllgwyngyllgogerychwyrndrobwllllantysiliogogogochensis]
MSSKPESEAPSDVRIPKALTEKLVRGELQLGQFLGMTRERLFDYAGMGHSMLQAGRTRLALEIFQGLVTAAPREPAFLTQLGATYLTLERTDEAFDAFQRALAVERSNVDALVGRGELLLRRGNIPDGLKDLSRAIELDPRLQKRSTQRARSTLLALKSQAEQIKGRPASSQKK